MKYEIEMTEQDIKDLRAVRNYFGENDRTIFEHKAYAILDGIVKKLNTPRVSKCEGITCEAQLNAFIEWHDNLSIEELAWYEGRYLEIFKSI